MNSEQTDPDLPEIYKYLPIFRIAMLVTVLLIGGILWVMIGSSAEQMISDELRGPMNILFLVLIAGIALIVMFVRRQIEKEESLLRKSIFALLAWASGEGLAILGAVLMIWGDPSFFYTGLIVLLMVMFVVPIPSST